MHFFPTLNAETQTALQAHEKLAGRQDQGAGAGVGRGEDAEVGAAVVAAAAAAAVRKETVAAAEARNPVVIVKPANVADINNLRQPSVARQKHLQQYQYHQQQLQQQSQHLQQQQEQQLQQNQQLQQLQQRQQHQLAYQMQAPRGELALGVAAMWPFWSAVAHQQDMLTPGRVAACAVGRGNRPEEGKTSSEDKHFSKKLNSAISHLLHKQEIAQPAAPQKVRFSSNEKRHVKARYEDHDFRDDDHDGNDHGDGEVDPTSGYDAWSQSSRLRSMEEDDDISDPGDPEVFLERADKKEVERNRCKLAEFLRRERICSQQMLECHETFRRSECDARVESIERVCGKEIHEVECQIESLKHKLLALEQQRDEMMADTTSTYLEMGELLRKDTERVAKAQRKLRACAGQDYVTARENVAAVMAFCKKRVDRSAESGRAPMTGAPISVGPEVPALRSEAAEDSVEAVLKAAKDAQATGKEFLHADSAMQRWILTGHRPSTKNVVRWLRTNAKLAKALGDRLLDLADQSNEMDFFDKVETFARKCSLLVFDGAADTLNEKPSANDDAGSSDTEPGQGREHSLGRASKKRRHETAAAYTRDIF
ncbi:Hypothetical Protein FCC1311_089522 [Hondaea fermentalgiana]|uniref:Uncharacterized protein n=1 Tax=Hondaea fermentalgiana TaxID=2315210 RepID=A0A2R5GPD3_9STRA|nr:Hypothetical Protein FCC1311_089522 [Hondaea fermentalgiana]|eukprot:GBG32727.1 Hypothetical Protein FCC1311_089522 [Hondaea fermentalgiana]